MGVLSEWQRAMIRNPVINVINVMNMIKDKCDKSDKDKCDQTVEPGEGASSRCWHVQHTYHVSVAGLGQGDAADGHALHRVETIRGNVKEHFQLGCHKLGKEASGMRGDAAGQ